MIAADLESLRRQMSVQARKLRLKVDRRAYAKAKRDPALPIAWAGNLRARVCILGRDLGEKVVLYGQPLVGSAGRTVREGVLRAVGAIAPRADVLLSEVLRYVLLSNLVPYKPPSNKPFPAEVREGFRPCIEQLLGCHWRGTVVITLGDAAFEWFGRYALSQQVAALRGWPDRYHREAQCQWVVRCHGTKVTRRLIVCPLPHPSPRNVRWRGAFPDLLARRLEAMRLRVGSHVTTDAI
jgi:uracil-DNA glycosylase